MFFFISFLQRKTIDFERNASASRPFTDHVRRTCGFGRRGRATLAVGALAMNLGAVADDGSAALGQTGLISYRYQAIDDCPVVIDRHTQLMWQRCAFGQIWNGQNCTGRAIRQDWQTAIRQQNQLCGYSDWSLPTNTDLEGLLTDDGMPAIDTEVFPNTPPASFWTGSVNETDSRQAWYVNFGKGGSQHTFKDANFHVRLVRMAR